MTNTMTSSLKAVHDQLLADKPDGAVHETDNCPFCAMTDDDGGAMTDEEMQAKVDQAVAAAVADRDAKIAELTAANLSNETAQAVAAATADRDAKIAELSADLDAKVLEAANAAAERDALVAWLEAEKVAAEQAAEIAARRETRLAKVKEVASFPDDYLNKNAERFAAMSDEDFEAACESWSALSSGKPAGSEIPSGTPAFKAGLEGPGSTGAASATKELLSLRRNRGHVDLTSL